MLNKKNTERLFWTLFLGCFLILLSATSLFAREQLQSSAATPTPVSTPTPTQSISSPASLRPEMAEGMAEGIEGLAMDTTGKCPGAFRVVGTDLCTHGPDAPLPGFSIQQEVAPINFANRARTATVQCDGDGISGNRVQVLYVRPSDRSDRYATYVESIRQWAADVDEIFAISAAATGGTRHIRFVHRSDCSVEVMNVVAPPESDDSFTYTISTLQKLGYNRKDRKYIIFMDSNKLCGIGDVEKDDRLAANNHNNIGPSYARVDNGCWSGRFAAHELMHNLGGVQLSAPHSSGGFHCTDQNDMMCYSDAPSYPTLEYRCTNPEDGNHFDCNHDDYYNTSPPPGSYLDTHWNAANSSFLLGSLLPTPTPTPLPSPTPTPGPGCTLYESANVPIAITDNGTTYSTLSIDDDSDLRDINLINLQIDHTFVGDLELALISPAGTRVLLQRNVGRDGQNFRGTLFDDDAEQPISVGVAPFQGRFRPQSPLAVLARESSGGSWRLQVIDTAKNDTGTLKAWGLELCGTLVSPPVIIQQPTAEPTWPPTKTPTPLPTSTPTLSPTPTGPPGTLTMILDVQPRTIQNFEFSGTLGNFVLDDAFPDDQDGRFSGIQRTVPAARYTTQIKMPYSWHLTGITCNPSDSTVDQSPVDAAIDLANQRVDVRVVSQQAVVCTFVSQRGVVIRTRSYSDLDANGRRDLGEPSLTHRKITLYSKEGTRMEEKLSNENGKANFNFLRPGAYTVCDASPEQRFNTQPGSLSASQHSPCYAVDLKPGQIATTYFGSRPTLSVDLAQSEPPATLGLTVSELPDVTDDNAGYNPAILEDSDALQSEDSTTLLPLQNGVYLPFARKP